MYYTSNLQYEITFSMGLNLLSSLKDVTKIDFSFYGEVKSNEVSIIRNI